MIFSQPNVICNSTVAYIRSVKNVLSIFMLVLIILLNAGCGGSKDTSTSTSSLSNKTASKTNKIELTFWNTMTPAEAEAFSPVISKFKLQHPDIEIQIESIPFNQARAKYEQSLKNGTAPDIFRCDRFWLADFAAANAIEPFYDDISKLENGDSVPIACNIVTMAGKVWALPHTLDCLALFYNKAHFNEANMEKPPEDFDSFREAARKLTDHRQGRYGFFLNSEGWWLEPFLFGFGGRYYNEAGESILDSDQTRKALHFLIDLKEADRSIPPLKLGNDSYGVMMQSFKSGQVSMIFNGPWAIRDILAGSAFCNDTSNLGVAQLPAGPVERHSPVGCQSFVISKGCKHIPQARQFIEFVCASEALSIFAKNTYSIPACKSLFEDPEIRNDPFLSPFIIQIQTLKSWKYQPRDGGVYEPIGKYLSAALNGDVPIDYTVRDMDSAIKKR